LLKAGKTAAEGDPVRVTHAECNEGIDVSCRSWQKRVRHRGLVAQLVELRTFNADSPPTTDTKTQDSAGSVSESTGDEGRRGGLPPRPAAASEGVSKDAGGDVELDKKIANRERAIERLTARLATADDEEIGEIMAERKAMRAELAALNEAAAGNVVRGKFGAS
jgi:hypothetical protein